MKTNRKTKLAKVVGLILVFALAISSVGVYGNVAEAKTKTKTSTKLKKACKAAAKKTGNAKKLNPEYTSSDPSSGPIEPEKISSLYYAYYGYEVYEIYVVKAKTTAYAKKAYKKFAKMKKSLYAVRFDFGEEQVKVIKNTIYGRKGKYVWYISMSTDKKKNQAGEAVLKKKL